MDQTKAAFENGILDHQLSLERSIAAILQLAQDGSPIPPAILLPLAQGAQETIMSAKELFSNNFTTDVYNRRTTPSSAAVSRKTFAIPEMLELILERVAHSTTLEKLLEVRLVCRQFDQCITGSIKLKRVLGLAPFDDQYFRAPLEFRRFSKIAVETNHLEWYRTATPINSMEVSVRFHNKSLSASSIWGRMSICQPPLQEIDCAYKNDCGPRSTITAKDGEFITVRDLHEFLKSAHRRHRYCCDEEHIVFSKSLTLVPDDPILAERRRAGLEDDVDCRKDEWTKDFDSKYPGYFTARAAGKWHRIVNSDELY